MCARYTSIFSPSPHFFPFLVLSLLHSLHCSHIFSLYSISIKLCWEVFRQNMSNKKCLQTPHRMKQQEKRSESQITEKTVSIKSNNKTAAMPCFMKSEPVTSLTLEQHTVVLLYLNSSQASQRFPGHWSTLTASSIHKHEQTRMHAHSKQTRQHESTP